PAKSGVRLTDMALFSRRKKTDDAAPAETNVPVEGVESPAADASTPATSADAGAAAAESPDTAAAAEAAPSIGISVQAFRGIGATAGPEVSLEPDAPKVSAQRPTAAAAGTPNVTSPAATPQADPAPRTLPLAP